MTTTTTVVAPAPQGHEDPRLGPVQNGRVRNGPTEGGARYGLGRYAVLAGMDCYGFGLGYDYYGATQRDEDGRRDPDDRRYGEATAPRSRTGRAVAIAVGGLVAAAAVGAGLVLGLGSHPATPAPAAAAAITDTGPAHTPATGNNLMAG